MSFPAASEMGIFDMLCEMAIPFQLHSLAGNKLTAYISD